jgi:hypothetical protein
VTSPAKRNSFTRQHRTHQADPVPLAVITRSDVVPGKQATTTFAQSTLDYAADHTGRPPAPVPVLTAVKLMYAGAAVNTVTLIVSLALQPVIHFGSGVTVLGLIVPALTWLVGLVAGWLLWRLPSSAFFKPQGFTQAGHSA